MSSTEDIGEEIKKSLRRLVIATVVIYLALATMGALAYYSDRGQREKLAEVTFSTNAALCAFRGDLAQRVSDSTQFLVDHPEGIPGIPVKSIQQSIDNEQHTLDALGNLECVAP